MKKILMVFIRWCVMATFFIPLVVVPSSFIFPFIVPKILLFRSLVMLMMAGYVMLLAINWEEHRPRLTPISLALLVFLASFLISTFVGVDPYHSFWDNHERMLGFFTVTHYVIYYFICTSVFRKWDEWKWVLRVFLFAGSIVMFIGVLQKANPDLLLNQGSDRVASTLGNAIYVGGYALFLFAAAAILSLKEKSTGWKVYAAILAVLALFGMIFSGTRGSLAGFIVGTLFAIAAYAIVMKEKPKLRLAFCIGIAVLIGSCLIVFLNRQASWVGRIPGVSRLVSISFHGAETRFIAWQIAIEGWKEKPIFGWGPNNYFYLFNKYYDPRSLEFGYGETWFDNAHNIILNTLAVQGTIGLIAYVGIFVVAIAVFMGGYRRRVINIHLAIIGSAFLIAHFVQNVTVFEDPTSYLYFTFWLALANSMNAAGSNLPSVSEGAKTRDNWIRPDRALNAAGAAAAFIVTAILIFITDIQPARANMKTLSALMDFEQNPITGLASMQDALQFSSPHIDDIRSDLTRAVIELVGRHYQELGRDRTIPILEVMNSAMQQNLALHPFDIRLYMMMAQLDQIYFASTDDARYVGMAEYYLKQAVGLTPRRQQFLYMLATIEAQLGKEQDAVGFSRQALDDDPKIGESYWRLAYVYYIFKDLDNAGKILAIAHQQNLDFDDQGQKIAATINAALAKTGTTKGSK